MTYFTIASFDQQGKGFPWNLERYEKFINYINEKL